MFGLDKAAKAYAAGTGGSLVFLVVFWVLNQAQVTPDTPFPAFWYKQLVWGGIWGLLFLAPVLTGKWWLRGIIVGGLATLAAIFIFNPAFQQAPVQVIGLAILLNCGVWGLSSSFLNDRVLNNA